MSNHINLVRIKAVAKALKELNDQVVFIGGAVVSLYLDRPELMDLRVTDDVDVIIEIANRGKYMLLQERLRAIGFKEDVDSIVICRWKIDGIIVDIMPTDPDIIGFTNPWYADGIKEHITKEIDKININLLSIPYFLATKMEALLNRDGGVDWRWSSDFEDIIKLIRECDLAKEFAKVENPKLQTFVEDTFNLFMKDEAYFFEACMAHLVKPFYSEDDATIIVAKVKEYLSE